MGRKKKVIPKTMKELTKGYEKLIEKKPEWRYTLEEDNEKSKEDFDKVLKKSTKPRK